MAANAATTGCLSGWVMNDERYWRLLLLCTSVVYPTGMTHMAKPYLIYFKEWAKELNRNRPTVMHASSVAHCCVSNTA